ncbi:chromate efflux transporter [Roseovarius sp. SCSIO 43702]|uniref:chromate efflux transporter n=1 Tax=Roseovarius sp. SCSIO 43702 TaxID=2823043 RepID=UPI001C73D1C6|nr:chromate efflux transporter [Roseovarius sp. SCSIO 43702]QYX55726.1 chromate efflux transporter [Roseovarius sp. SCSIO 43702]
MAPTYPDLFSCFARIGLLSFGGPAAQIALMHDELVARRGWLSEDRFLGALSFCMLLPGPEAMQLATYAGWRLRGVPGGLLAGLLFVLPGAAVILLLAGAYAAYADLAWVQAAFLGVKAAVVAIVLRALWGLSRKALRGPLHWGLAAAAFVAMYVLAVPFPLVILGAGLAGAILGPRGDPAPHAHHPGHRHLWRLLPVFGALWAAPLALAHASGAEFLTDIGLFFSKLAVVTFGGAYAVLAYMTEVVVETHGWITTDQMIDALGLAETTPGPLILVTEFVGLLAGFAQGGWPLALLAGAMTLWVTFLPCFLWIFAGAPYVDWLLGRPRLRGALSGVSAAVVGVTLNLALWFAFHVLFAATHRTPWGAWPDLATFEPLAAALLLVSAAALLVLRWAIPATLAVASLLALGVFALG